MATLVGRVGLVIKGAWDSSVAYTSMDVVTYNNSTYIAKQAVPAGTLPTNTTYWELSLDASTLTAKTAISTVETTNTAVSAHTVGSYFINASGQFVKTTSAITIGDTIIVKPAVGYNCEVTTVSEVLDIVNNRTIALTSRARRNITNDLANLSQAVSEQNLEKYGYKIGDYFNGSSGYTYILADLNTFKGTSTPYCITTNHAGIVVDTHSLTKWHTESAAAVGYEGSTLHAFLTGTVLNTIKTDFVSLFGGSTGLEHLLSHSKHLANKLAAWHWVSSQYISALTCTQIDAGNQWIANQYQQGEASKSLEVFRKYKWTNLTGNENFWMRELSNNDQTGSYACRADQGGLLGGADSVTSNSTAVGLICFY